MSADADRAELAELVRALQAHLAWERMCGAQVLPVDPAAVARAPSAAAPRAEARAPAPSSPPRSAPAPRAPEPARPPPRAAAPSFTPPPSAGQPSAPPPSPGPPSAPPPQRSVAPPQRPDVGPQRPDLGAQRPPLAPQPPSAPALVGAASAAPARPGQLSLGAWGALAAAPPPASAPPPPPVDFSAPADLEGLRALLGDCTRCGLCEKRDKLVFGVGDPAARLLIVGEAPGREEDRRGEPFVGESGQMLDRMLRNVLGFGREAVYIANVVKCRPPENRDPQPEEIARCRPVLHAQLRIIRPALVLVLGRVAFQALFDTSEGITRARGSWRTLRYPGGEARALVTFHPAYLLREPDAKRLVFEDLKAMARALADGGEAPPPT